MGLTLREGNREYFYSQLDRLFPHMKEKYICTYGMQYQLSSPKHNGLMKLFHQICEDSGIMHDNSKIFEYLYSFAAEQKARVTYDNILRLSDDPDVNDVIKFLRAREIVHFQRFGETKRTRWNKMKRTADIKDIQDRISWMSFVVRV